jgi:hypothetical protein
MNTRLATLTLLAVGGILIAGTARSILAAPHGFSRNVIVTFESPNQTPQSAAEPLFPGQLSR